MQYRIDLKSLHKGDYVFWKNRRLVVLSINRDEQRVLVRGRKHSCGNCDLRWVEAWELATRPARLFGVEINSLHQMRDTDQEAVLWSPKRVPEPTDTVPGSVERIAVYRERVERGERLFHADDSGCEGVLGGVRTDGEEWASALFSEAEENRKASVRDFVHGA